MTDAVIVSTARTGLGKSWKGAFNMTYGATLGAHSVRHAVERPVIVEGKSMIMTASLGVAIYPDDAHDSVRLLRIADQRMYATKHRPGMVPSKGVTGLAASVGDTAVIAIASGQR